MLKRSEVIDIIKPFIVNRDDVMAVWEGGSAATNTLDAYSDLDLMVVVEDHAVEDVMQAMDAFLSKSFGIAQSYRVPEPAWHGFSQTFYQLNQTPAWFYLDFCVLPQSINDPFTAPDRHGVGLVWVDKAAFIKREPTPKKMVEKRAKAAYERATGALFVMTIELEKAFLREHYLDAYHGLYAFMMRSLVPLLNLHTRKAQVDFGLRYAERVYASEDLALIESFFKASDFDALKTIKSQMFARFEALKPIFDHEFSI